VRVRNLYPHTGLQVSTYSGCDSGHLVNTQTHTHRQEDRQTSFEKLYATNQPAELITVVYGSSLFYFLFDYSEK